jgi:hypothetical protein
LPDVNLSKESSSLDERSPENGPSAWLGQLVEQASLPSRLTLDLIQIHYNTVLMDLLSVVSLSKESSLLDERLRIHSSKLNLTAIVGGAHMPTTSIRDSSGDSSKVS